MDKNTDFYEALEKEVNILKDYLWKTIKQERCLKKTLSYSYSLVLNKNLENFLSFIYYTSELIPPHNSIGGFSLVNGYLGAHLSPLKSGIDLPGFFTINIKSLNIFSEGENRLTQCNISFNLLFSKDYRIYDR